VKRCQSQRECAPEQQPALKPGVRNVSPGYEWQIEREPDQYTTQEAIHAHGRSTIWSTLLVQPFLVNLWRVLRAVMQHQRMRGARSTRTA